MNDYKLKNNESLYGNSTEDTKYIVETYSINPGESISEKMRKVKEYAPENAEINVVDGKIVVKTPRARTR